MSSNQKTFVMNNLTDEQLKALDDDYPKFDAVSDTLEKAIDEHDVSIALRAQKDGGFVAYVNQGNYAVSGRSGGAWDALVVALFKLTSLGYDLSSGQASTKRTTRG